MSAEDPASRIPLEIDAAFEDHNGHVGMAHHLVLADRAVDGVLTSLKADPDYGARTGRTTFAAEVHIRYVREMSMTDALVGRVLLLEADAKRVRWAIELIRADDGDVVTTVEGVTLSVSLETRRVAPFPEDLQARIAALVARHAAAPAPGWLGGTVGMRRP